jgi:hypothetical protein
MNSQVSSLQCLIDNLSQNMGPNGNYVVPYFVCPPSLSLSLSPLHEEPTTLKILFKLQLASRHYKYPLLRLYEGL